MKPNRPTIKEAKEYVKSIGLRLTYASQWREFAVKDGNPGHDYFTADVIDAMQTATTIAAATAPIALMTQVGTSTHEHAIELGDDGTMDTVLVCTQCSEEFRGTYDGPGGEVDYTAWVGEFIEEVAAEHVCDELRAEWDATNSGLIKGRKE